jgi:signal peptidase I
LPNHKAASVGRVFINIMNDMETSSSKPRRTWLAGILSLLGGPLGQVYVGRLRRSLCLWIVGACLLPILCFCTISLPIGSFGFVLLVLCALAFPIYCAVDAFLLARWNRQAPLKRYQRWWIYILLLIVFCLANNAVAYFVRSSIAEAFVIPTRGMVPTIQPGDRIMVDRLWYNRNRIQRNDVVVFRSEGPESPLFIQRVAGLPRDEIEIKNERVFVNGAEWHDSHAVFNGPLPPFGAPVNYGPIKVPLDCYFLLGDNRRLSKDSRLMGPIPMSDLHGIARIIYWSRERTFPNPADTTHYVTGPIQWKRLGLRLD